jgi:protein involved in polysaccharide export with SLBB domain
VFNALYAAGGPSLNVTLRNVKLIREGKTIGELDFYDYLLRGEQKNNLRLQDQDVIFISPYQERVEIKGEVKRPLYYDLQESETLKSLLFFAGGTTGKAYTQRFKVFRKTGIDNRVFDVSMNHTDTMKLENGDLVMVDSVISRFENRVEIKGAVYRPGVFALDSGLTLKQLIKKSDGLRGDAFKNRVSIFRTREDLTMEVIPVDLQSLMSDPDHDILLQREDLVMIPSLFDLKEEYIVQNTGEIRKPGPYSFVAGSSVEDLILRAGGLLESASYAKLEIARRVKNNMANTSSNQVAQIFQFPISMDLKLTESVSKFILEPFDQVFIRRSPGYEVQEMVKIVGEVAFPGSYIIADKKEKISDLINRAGGLTQEAYVKGSRLVRKLPIDKKQRLEALKAIASHSRDSAKLDYSFLNDETTIGIYLDKILAHPGSTYDINLQKGDSIVIPKELQTVRLTGAVLFPVTVRYDQRYNFKSYINRAGGFAPEAKNSKTYIIYANGSIDRTRKLLFFNQFPRVEPGAEIVVPKKPEKKGLSAAETVGITSALATMALVIVEIITILK